MRFAYWSREIVGWLLILAGMWLFWNTYALVTDKRIFSAGPVAFLGFVVFRGGIHLLKVAVAAQVSRTLPENAQPATRKPSRMATRSVAPTQAKAVLPGPRNRPVAADRMAE